MSQDNSIFFELDREILDLARSKSQHLPDVHYDTPRVSVSLDWAGIHELKYFVKTKVGADILALPVTINSVTDLPASMRGFNVSRHNEVLDKVIARYATKPYEGNLVNVVADSAIALLEAHEYSTKSKVDLTFEYPYIDQTPVGLSTHESATVFLGAWAEKRESDVQITGRRAGIRIGGALACPLAFELSKDDFRRRLESLGISSELMKEILKEAPLGTHTEHSYSRIILETPSDIVIDFRDILSIAREALGVPFRELLKRHSELLTLKYMLNENNTRFAEDVVRDIVEKLLDKCSDLPPETVVEITQESLFTFSRFKIHVEKSGTLGQLASELDLSVR